MTQYRTFKKADALADAEAQEAAAQGRLKDINTPMDDYLEKKLVIDPVTGAAGAAAKGIGALGRAGANGINAVIAGGKQIGKATDRATDDVANAFNQTDSRNAAAKSLVAARNTIQHLKAQAAEDALAKATGKGTGSPLGDGLYKDFVSAPGKGLAAEIPKPKEIPSDFVTAPGQPFGKSMQAPAEQTFLDRYGKDLLGAGAGGLLGYGASHLFGKNEDEEGITEQERARRHAANAHRAAILSLGGAAGGGALAHYLPDILKHFQKA